MLHPVNNTTSYFSFVGVSCTLRDLTEESSVVFSSTRALFHKTLVLCGYEVYMNM